MRLTASLVVVGKVTVSVCEEFGKATRCRRFQSGDVVVVIHARRAGVEALEPAVRLAAAGEGVRAYAGALATISFVVT